MRVLITGVSGFIGYNLMQHFRNKYTLFTPLHQQLDILDSESLKKYVRETKIQIIIHRANTNDVAYNLTPYDVLNNGLRMFYSVEKCAFYCDRIIYFGSGAEYDRSNYIPKMKEEYFDQNIPQDPYGFAKYTESKLVHNHDNIYDLRLFGVYGKKEQWQRRFISNNIVRSLKGLPMTLSQNAMFDYLYVEDLCRIVEWFIEHEPKHKHYNVCTGQPIALQELAHMINEVSGLHREIQIAKDGWQSEYSGDNSRLLAEMGEFQFTDKKISIEKMWHYYAEHADEFDERQLLL